MKNIVTICICFIMALLVITFRSEVYDITAQQLDNKQTSSGALVGHSPITVHYHDRRPYYLNINGEVHGLVADAVTTVLQYADIEFTWLETPATRQLDIVRANISRTCAAGWFKTAEREGFSKFTLPVYQDQPFVAITRKDNELIGDNEMLDRLFLERRLSLLVKSGYSYGSYIDDKMREHNPRQIITTADNKTMLNMLQTHRADYCFMTEEEAYDLLLFSGLNKMDFRVTRLQDVPSGNKRYLICSRMVSDTTIDRINGAIRQLLHMKEERE